jgi:cytoskeletal protein CcmA (bactofilin family)
MPAPAQQTLAPSLMTNTIDNKRIVTRGLYLRDESGLCPGGDTVPRFGPDGQMLFSTVSIDGCGNMIVPAGLAVGDNVDICGGLLVDGNGDFGGDMNISGDTYIHQNIYIDGSGAIGGDLNISGDTYIHQNIYIDGSGQIGGDLNISGDTYIHQNIVVDGDGQIGGDLNISGDTYIHQNIVVDGDGKIGGDFNISGDIVVNGNGQIGADMNIGGSTYINIDLTVEGRGQINGDVEILGDTQVHQDLTVDGKINAVNIEVNGVMTISGDLTVDRIHVRDYIDDTRDIVSINTDIVRSKEIFVGSESRNPAVNVRSGYSLEVSGAAFVNGTFSAADGLLYVDSSNGRVGVGTQTPAYKLDVSGNFRGGVLTAPAVSGPVVIDTVSSYGNLHLQTADPLENCLFIKKPGQTNNNGWLVGTSTNITIDNKGFGIANVDNGIITKKGIFIDASGNVGIGKSNPNGTLHVHTESNTATSSLWITNNQLGKNDDADVTDATLILGSTYGGNPYYTSIQAVTATGAFGDAVRMDLCTPQINNNNTQTPRVSILSGASTGGETRVGINKTNPQKTLDVSGVASVTTLEASYILPIPSSFEVTGSGSGVTFTINGSAQSYGEFHLSIQKSDFSIGIQGRVAGGTAAQYYRYYFTQASGQRYVKEVYLQSGDNILIYLAPGIYYWTSVGILSGPVMNGTPGALAARFDSDSGFYDSIVPIAGTYSIQNI